MPKHACERCHLDFRSATHLSTHQRMETSCTLVVGEPQAEIDKAKLEALRCRKRIPGKREMTEHEKWERVYTILFPDDRSVPSPCEPVLFHYFYIRLAAGTNLIQFTMT